MLNDKEITANVTVKTTMKTFSAEDSEGNATNPSWPSMANSSPFFYSRNRWTPGFLSPRDSLSRPLVSLVTDTSVQAAAPRRPTRNRS